MSTIAISRLAGVVAACTLVVAPQALAKPVAHSSKAGATRVHRFTPDDPAATTTRLSILSGTGLGTDAYNAPWSAGPGV